MAMGKEMGLTGEKLAEFVEKNEAKFAAEIDREERRIEREMKQKELEMKIQADKDSDERKQKHLELEVQSRKDMEEQRLRAEVEIEALKLKALELESSNQRSGESSMIEVSTKPKPKIPFFDEKVDDMDAYLERFEWVAENYNWEKTEWSFHLSQYLRGKATEAYTRLSKTDRKDYDIVKETLLRRYNLTDKGYRKKFRESLPEDEETPQQFMVRLKDYLEKWIQLSGGKSAIDLFLVEQFINSCPPELAAYLKQSKIQTPDVVAEDADRYLTAQVRKLNLKPASRKHIPRSSALDNVKAGPCLICNEGHMARECSKNKTGKYCVRCRNTSHNTVDCKATDKFQSQVPRKTAANFEQLSQEDNDDKHSVEINGKRYIEIGYCKTVRPVCGKNNIVQGLVNGMPASVLRDTGCNTVLVRKSFVKPHQFTGDSGYCLLADGTARKMEIASIDIDTPYYKGSVVAMVSEKAIHDLLIGNIPGVKLYEELNVPDNQCNVLTRSQCKAENKLMKPLVLTDVEGEPVDKELLIRLQKEDESIRRLFSAKQVKRKGNQSTRFFTNKSILYIESMKILQ